MIAILRRAIDALIDEQIVNNEARRRDLELYRAFVHGYFEDNFGQLSKEVRDALSSDPPQLGTKQ